MSFNENDAQFVENIARGCYNVNQVYCYAIGDGMFAGVPWEEASEATRESLRAGVRVLLVDSSMTPEQLHAAWLAFKTAQGWKYGSVKDEAKKEHPCFVPYDQLPKEQRVKDHLFRVAIRVQTEIAARTMAAAASLAGLP